MGHYAKVERIKNPNAHWEEGPYELEVVTQVIVANAEFIASLANTNDPNLRGEWLKTSYNTKGGVHYEPNPDGGPNATIPSQTQEKALRYNYAGIGNFYDREADAFYKPAPYPSWVLDRDTFTWHAPVARPDHSESPSGAGWVWSESAHQANNQAGWMDWQDYVDTYNTPLADHYIDDPDNPNPKDYDGFEYSF